MALTWTPVVIGDDTPWVRDFRGLWGHDTQDKLGGERGPAGPRYERDGTVRASWGDPVGWAGLAKVAPNPQEEQALVARRIADLERELGQLDADVASARDSMAVRAAGLVPASATVQALEAEEAQRTAARLTALRLADERQHLMRIQRDGVPSTDPHAHLSHRRTPIGAQERSRSWFLAGWAVVSTPLALWLISVLFRPDILPRWQLAVGALVLVLSVEAFARGYLFAFLGRLFLLLLIVDFVLVLGANWQRVTAATLAILAFVVLIVNIRDVWRR
jgi:hypothetical protein